MAVSNYKPSVRLLAFEQKWNEHGEPYTEVHEELRTIVVTKSALAVLEEILNFNGQTLRGAKDSTYALLGKTYLAPFTINEVQELYLFYTGPLKKDETKFFMSHAIDHVEDSPDGGVIVTLTNGKQIYCATGIQSFENRIYDVAKLQHKREQRTKLLKRDFQYCAEFNEKYGSELEEK